MRFQGALTAALTRHLGSDADELAEAISACLRPGPLLAVPPATDRSMWDLAEGRADRRALGQIVEHAEDDRGRPWPVPRATDAVRFHRDGDRTAWERAAFGRQDRLSLAAVAAAATLDASWLDEVADGLWLLCEQSSWCWPAHDDAFSRHGSVLPRVTDPFVDLGAGEVVGQLAWVDHLLAEPLDRRFPGLRDRLRHESAVRIFEPFRRRRDWHWLGVDGQVHNWNPWIHGNVLIAALQFLDAPERTDILALIVEGLDRYVTSLPSDGAIDEGYAYWWNGACRALEALDALAYATQDRVDPVGEIAALRETVAFPHRMHLGGGWYLNLADGPARPPVEQPWHELHHAARRVGDTAAQAHAASHRVHGHRPGAERAGLGRLLRGLTDPQWLAATPAATPLPAQVWLGSTQVLVARERRDDRHGLTVAGKGGHNGENHNHNDVGSFVVASDGVPVIVDAGRPTYTAQTFGPDRYSLWPMQSSWHNVPEVRGTPQHVGADAAAVDVGPHLDRDSAALTLDLAHAYRAPGLSSWRRTVRLERDSDPPRVVVEDDWSLEEWAAEGEEPPTTVRLLVAGEVALAPGGAVVVPLEGATPVRVAWGDADASTTVLALDDPMLAQVWGARLTRIEIDVRHRNHLAVHVEQHSPTTQDAR